MREHGIAKEVAKDDGSGIVRSICVDFAKRSSVWDLIRTEKGGATSGFYKGKGGFLTSPVVVYVSHDENFSTGGFPFPFRAYKFGFTSKDFCEEMQR